MSGRARRRRHLAGWSRQWKISGALAVARAQGCVCKPSTRLWHEEDGTEHIEAAHEVRCPMGNAPSTAIIFTPGDGGAR